MSPDDGEPFDLAADSRDIATWERVSRGKSFGALQADLRMGDLYAIAHLTAQRHNLGVGTLTEFTKENALELLDDDEGAADPTPPGR